MNKAKKGETVKQTYKEFLEDIVDNIRIEMDSRYRNGDTVEMDEIIYGCIDNALIYYHVQLFVMENTSNEDAYFDHMGDTITGDSYMNVIGQLALHALCEDIMEYIDYNRLEDIAEYLNDRMGRAA